MRVGVLRTQVPFVSGGAERHAAGLVAALQRHGHEAAEVTLPFKWYPGEVLADHILAAKLTDLSEVEGVPVDRMIGLKFPAYLARHPKMQFWIIHQHRQAYDQWEAGNSDLLDDPDGMALRALIQEEDRAAFTASPHPIYANSRNVAARLKNHLGLASTPLYHPPPQADIMDTGPYGDYLFAPGRINPSKRLELILDALAKTGSSLRLVVAGTAENPAYEAALHQRAADLGIMDRVTWLGRVDDDMLRRSYAEARAVVFVPQDEDYGYITLEAMLSAKPVITTQDAGGPLEFITHHAQGLIATPKPKALAQCFEEILQDRALAERLGQAGYDHYHSLNISWDHVVETLVGPSKAQPAPQVAVPQDPVAQLRTAIAPPSPPAHVPFTSVQEVLEKYAFEELPAELGEADPPVDAGFAAYIGTHWTRYLTTLDAVKHLTPQDTLDVGVFPPLIFQAILSEIYPGLTMAGLWEGMSSYTQEVRYRADGRTAFSMQIDTNNSERDPWPYPDNSFDLITGMEILEHFVLDPYFFYTEANRVLRPGGHLLVTTPNVTSHHSLSKLLNGHAPYSFGVFVPSGGVYARHNREYAPEEVATLGQAAGFETVTLKTVDVYGGDIVPEVAKLLVARGDDLRLRGENILYLARKTDRPQKDMPAGLYHGNPALMRAVFEPSPRDVKTGTQKVRLKNTSAHTWQVAGPYGTCLLAEWLNGEGVLKHQLLIQPFTTPIPAGTAGEITLPSGPEGPGQLRLHAYQIGVGVFSGTGHAETISLPCSQAAFHAIARQMPKPQQGS